MARSLDIGASGMLAQQMNVDVISNNIANMTTNGFKRQRVDFKDLIYQNIDRPGTQSSDAGTLLPSGLQLGLGVRVGSVYRINEQGPLQVTENPLDLAINGDGFFQVAMPDGTTGYTRSGILQIDESGQLVTTQGFPIEPSISIPSDAVDVEVNAQGEVLVSINGQTTQTNAGQIQLASFINPAGLEAKGNNLFVETTASGTPTLNNPGSDNLGSLQQGAVESSNVNVVEEITRLIEAQRAYEMNSNVIRTSDEMMQQAGQLR